MKVRDYIPVDKIRSFVGSKGVDDHRVTQFVNEIENGVELWPIVVYKNKDDENYWYTLKDGRHRLLAHKQAGESLIFAEIMNAEA